MPMRQMHWTRTYVQTSRQAQHFVFVLDWSIGDYVSDRTAMIPIGKDGSLTCSVSQSATPRILHEPRPAHRNVVTHDIASPSCLAPMVE